MRIVSWNCNGALRNKLYDLIALDADVYIVQECEDPARCSSDDYKLWAKNYLWVGTNKNRGLGIFAKKDLLLEAVPIDTAPLELFIPCKINGSISILATWTLDANSPTFRYIGQLWKFLQKYESFFHTEYAALIGDLNSNACWDVWDRWWNHSDVVRQLKNVGLNSLYHCTYNELQGAESRPTFYMYRKLERPYHIDYAFLSDRLLNGAKCDIGSPSSWIKYSDHMPLVIDIPLIH